jgi:hypothetical protein
MGATDVERQKPNVFRMKLLGAEVVPVTAGAGTLKDAMNEALRDWVTNVHDTYYIIGTAAGPHPYPGDGARFPVHHRQETKEQIMKEGRLPTPCRLHRRRLQRHRHLPSVSGRYRSCRCTAWRRAGMASTPITACRLDHRRPPRRAARDDDLFPAGR